MKRDAESANAPQRRAQPGRGPAIVLAVLVHLAFLALIVFGVSWQSSPVAPLQAELWDKLPSAVKPAPAPTPKVETPPKPQPQPQSQFGPLPPAKITPAPLKPPEVKPAPPKPDPEIAEKAERLKREQAEAAKQKQLQEEAAKKKAQEEAAKKKAEEDAAKKKAAEEAAKKKQQEEAQRKKREEEQRAAAQAQAEAARQRAAAAAAASARQRAVDEWVDKIRRKILSRANVPDTVPTGAELNVRIRILPGGDVLDFTVTSSTNPTYRAAIERAIRSASPLPVPDPNSELFSQFRDLNVNFKHER